MVTQTKRINPAEFEVQRAQVLKEFPNLKAFMMRIARDKQYPDWSFRGYLDFLVGNPKMKKALFDAGVFIRAGKKDGQETYTLGPAGIQMVSAWESEELGKRSEILNNTIARMTWMMLAFTAILTVIGVIQFIIEFSKLGKYC